MADPAPPSVPEQALDDGGWAFVEESVETLFELAAASIRGATVEYADERTRTALREGTDGAVDHRIRFFAATRLGFSPPLPPGVTPSMVAPTLRSEAKRSFADRLRGRGLADVSEGRSERIRVADRSRARLTKYTATDPLEDVEELTGGTAELPLECWIAVWTSSSDVTIVTGGYPAVELASQFGLDSEDDALTQSPDSYREEFISLTRDVE